MKTSAFIPRCPQRIRRQPSAFSLVEVTIAVAIAALGFITILALLPQGLTMARNSSELSVGTKIMQKLSGDMQSMSWSRITWTGYGPLRYFTNEGREMTAADTTPEAMASSLTYVASVYVPQTPLDVVLPSGTNTGTAEPYLRRVKICLTTANDPAFDFNSVLPQRITSTYAFIAMMGE